MSAIWKIQGRAAGGIAPDQQAEITRVAARAVRHYAAGKLQDAERDCQTILARDPNHIQSLLLLKGVAQQLGRHEAVVDLLVRIAKTFLTYGRLEAAAAYFTEIVMLRPDLAEPYHFLGIAHGQQGKTGEAGSWFELLLTLRPDDPLTYNNLGFTLQQQGRLEEAQARYRKAIEIKPDMAVAHRNLAATLTSAGQLDEARQSYQSAAALEPNEPATYLGLAMVASAQGKRSEALQLYQQALTIKPDYTEALNNLANLMEKEDRLEEAVVYYRRAITTRPDLAEAHVNLGLILAELGRLDEAGGEAEIADRLPDRAGFPHVPLGLLLARCGRAERARAHFELSLRHDPDDRQGARLMLARMDCAPTPARIPDALLQAIYEGRAASWDKNVAGAASYRGARLVASTLLELTAGDERPEVLDAGCGTGLVGELLHARAKRIEGADLSPAMIAKAREKGIYQALHQADLVALMRACPQRFDAVASAATLIHFGDLGPVFDAAGHALRDGGLFVFTVFPSTDPARTVVHPDIGLAFGGCYAHGHDQIERLAVTTGFTVVTMREEIHEYHRGKPRMCLLVALRRRPRG